MQMGQERGTRKRERGKTVEVERLPLGGSLVESMGRDGDKGVQVVTGFVRPTSS